MKIKPLSFSIPFVLLVAIAGQPAGAAQALTKVTMTTGSFSEREAAMFVAQDQGLFRRYGLDLTFVHVRNGPIGMAALAAGESQLHEGSVTGAVLGSAAEGTDLVFVAGMINKLIGNIMASPKIKNPSDLKGKVIAVTSMSGGSWMFTTLALEYWGLDAKRDGSPFASSATNPCAAKHCLMTPSRQPISDIPSRRPSKVGALPTLPTSPNCPSLFKAREY
jgi:ABC-type nitrate/sulfonate/bicarbonate transport system substrate-binding protein